ncbi:ankyrin repeat domain-containing protein 45 [Patella vulgata]|uniref:ankyrin repeat domain-containing protein 45 n=1 Tax=Patella vulgata TaxID=6465 RepID=UPI0021809940|nr:ankyrin repeat domain-containing protein 45 [Patella vulgata]
MTLPEAENLEEVKQPEVLLPNTNIVTHCVLKNDVARLVKCFEDEEDEFKEGVETLLNVRNEEGKSPLDLAAMLGRIDITRELLQRGADVANNSNKGFSPIHYAAAWGRIGVLKTLVEFQVNLQQKNSHGERARETALRYNQTECMDYLDWAEAKVNLILSIKHIQEWVTDPERIQGRLNKEEKNLSVNACKEKTEWVESTVDATTQDFIQQKANIEELVGPIMQKLSEPLPEKPEKK